MLPPASEFDHLEGESELEWVSIYQGEQARVPIGPLDPEDPKLVVLDEHHRGGRLFAEALSETADVNHLLADAQRGEGPRVEEAVGEIVSELRQEWWETTPEARRHRRALLEQQLEENGEKTRIGALVERGADLAEVAGKVGQYGPLGGLVESAAETVQGALEEFGTVYENTTPEDGTAKGLVVAGGTALATETGVRGVSDAFSTHDAVDGHEQGWLERVVDGVTGAAALVGTAVGLSRAANGLRGLFRRTGKQADEVKRLEFLRQVRAGKAFDESQSGRFPHNQLYVEQPSGKGYYILDSYNPRLREIVSRKLSQLADVSESTALGYLRELATKYRPGARIAEVPTSGILGGKTLRGRMILEVPVQERPVPENVLKKARYLEIVIRDVSGRVY